MNQWGQPLLAAPGVSVVCILAMPHTKNLDDKSVLLHIVDNAIHALPYPVRMVRANEFACARGIGVTNEGLDSFQDSGDDLLRKPSQLLFG